MKTLKGLFTLLKRFFFGTPKSEVNVNNFLMAKLESNYLRYQLAEMTRKNKSLELKVRLTELKTV